MASREYWKRIPEFPHYSVSSKGRVRTEPRIYRNEETFVVRHMRKRRILKPEETANGLHVRFKRNGINHTRSLRNLVAAAFLSPAAGGRLTYRDGNPYNCSVENLIRKFKDGRKSQFIRSNIMIDMEYVLKQASKDSFDWKERAKLAKKLGVSDLFLSAAIRSSRKEGKCELK